MMVAPQVITLQDVSEGADRKHDTHEYHEPCADRRLGKSVHRAHETCPREQRPEEREQECGEDEPDIPALHHAFLFLHHDGVQKGSAGEPRHETCVLDRVPSPVSSSPEYCV